MALEAPPRRRQARPVADAPIDALLARVEEITKGWLLALLEAAPLHETPAILGAPLAHDGPRVCDAALRALADDGELRRLERDGSLRPLLASIGPMTGAGSPSACARAIDALCDVLWSALLAELRAPASDLVSALAERLARVGALLRDAAIESGRSEGGGSGETVSAPVFAPSPAFGPSPAFSAEPAQASAPAPVPTTGSVPPLGGTPLWMSALAEELRESDAAGRPLSLLLAELEDADRVVASATPEDAGEALGEFAAALRGVLRGEDILVCEDDARAWVIARGTARARAHSLGAQIAEAVGESRSRSGAPLVASVGVAVLGEDGASPVELVEAAEEARFSASARGIEVSRRVPEHDRR